MKSEMGWECPRCHSTYAPWMSSCSSCHNTPPRVFNTDDPEVRIAQYPQCCPECLLWWFQGEPIKTGPLNEYGSRLWMHEECANRARLLRRTWLE